MWTALVTIVALLGIAASAPAATRTIPGSTRGDVVEFRVAKLKGKRVKRAEVRAQGRRIRVSRDRLRRATRRGRLTVRVPRRAARRPGAAPVPASRPVLIAVLASAPAPARPAPAHGAAAGPCAPDPAAQGTARIPGACWRPYGPQSPFNRTIGASPRVHERSSEYVAKLTSLGAPQSLPAGQADTADDWNHPTYYSAPSDPAFTVDCVQDWGECPIEGHQVRIPDAARAARGGDGHLAVVDAETGWEYDFWQVRSKPAGGGTLRVSWGGRTRIDGDGLGSGATAANYGNLAGIIRAPELAAGRIDHALFLVFRCDAGSGVYPAAKGGSSCSSAGQPTGGAFPMGTRFQLDMSAQEIEALPVPRWKKTVLRAMADYGMYFGDTGGRSWGIQFESGSTYTSFGAPDPFTQIAAAAGEGASDGVSWMNLAGGVDWRSRLRALDPCTARGSC